MYTLNTIEKHKVCYSIENHPNDSRVKMDNEDTVQTLSSRMGTGGGNVPLTLVFNGRKYIVRRLTPNECALLQGFPEWWTKDVPGGDGNAYRMWGNGIALPCAADVLGRIAKEIEKETKGE